MTRTEATRRNYEIGYRHGVTGRDMVAGYAERYVGYADGWDHGHCDMPTWDERHPIDVAKERSTGCLD